MVKVKKVYSEAQNKVTSLTLQLIEKEVNENIEWIMTVNVRNGGCKEGDLFWTIEVAV